MDNFDYSKHGDVNLYVSEHLNVKMKSAQNLKIHTSFKTHYIHIADHLHKS